MDLPARGKDKGILTLLCIGIGVAAAIIFLVMFFHQSPCFISGCKTTGSTVTTQPGNSAVTAPSAVPVYAPVVTSSLSPSSPTIDRGEFVNISVSVSGGTPPYSYSWYKGSSPICSLDAYQPFINTSFYHAAPSSNAYYCVTVTDSSTTPDSANTATDLVTVSNSLYLLSVTASNAMADQNSYETLNATWIGGTGPYTTNMVVYNGINNAIIYNSLISGLTSNQRLYTFIMPNTANDLGTLKVNFTLVDSAATHVSLSQGINPSNWVCLPPTGGTFLVPQTPRIGAQRNQTLYPWSTSSPFNLPLGTGEQFVSLNNPQQVSLSHTPVGIQISTYKTGVPIYFANSTTPIANVLFQDVGTGNFLERYAISPTAQPEDGVDNTMVIISPNNARENETHLMVQNTTYPLNWTTDDFRTDSLFSNGIIAFNPDTTNGGGIRGSGINLLAGLPRVWELQNGSIDHALIIQLSLTQQAYNGTIVYPAHTNDCRKPNNMPCSKYSGNVVMGSLLAIPDNVSIASLGLSPYGNVIAQALQDYGGYDEDSAGSGGLIFVSVPNAKPYLNNLNAPDNGNQYLGTNDIAKIYAQLRIVSNNQPANAACNQTASGGIVALIAPIGTTSVTTVPATTSITSTTITTIPSTTSTGLTTTVSGTTTFALMPTLSISPYTLVNGSSSSITVTGSGFTPGGSISMTMSISGNTIQTWDIAADASGRFIKGSISPVYTGGAEVITFKATDLSSKTSALAAVLVKAQTTTTLLPITAATTTVSGTSVSPGGGAGTGGGGTQPASYVPIAAAATIIALTILFYLLRRRRGYEKFLSIDTMPRSGQP